MCVMLAGDSMPAAEDAELATVAQAMNFFDLQSVATASDVAKYTWEGVKRGRFLITMDWVGHLLAVVSRGPIPEDSIVSNIWELLFVIPIRMLSFVLKRSMMRTILRLATVPAHTEIGAQILQQH